MVKPVQTNDATSTEKQNPPAPSKWKTKEVIKYTGIGAAGLATIGLAYSQLLETVQKVPEAVKTAYETIKTVPSIVRTVNDGIDASKNLYWGIGKGISWLRWGANFVVKPAPVPTTDEGTTALGFEFVNNAWVGASTVAANVAYLAPVLLLMGGVTGKPGKKTGITGLTILTLQAAIPGFVGKVMNCANNTITSVGETMSQFSKWAGKLFLPT